MDEAQLEQFRALLVAFVAEIDQHAAYVVRGKGGNPDVFVDMGYAPLGDPQRYVEVG